MDCRDVLAYARAEGVGSSERKARNFHFTTVYCMFLANI